MFKFIAFVLVGEEDGIDEWEVQPNPHMTAFFWFRLTLHLLLNSLFLLPFLLYFFFFLLDILSPSA